MASLTSAMVSRESSPSLRSNRGSTQRPDPLDIDHRGLLQKREVSHGHFITTTTVLSGQRYVCDECAWSFWIVTGDDENWSGFRGQPKVRQPDVTRLDVHRGYQGLLVRLLAMAADPARQCRPTRSRQLRFASLELPLQAARWQVFRRVSGQVESYGHGITFLLVLQE